MLLGVEVPSFEAGLADAGGDLARLLEAVRTSDQERTEAMSAVTTSTKPSSRPVAAESASSSSRRRSHRFSAEWGCAAGMRGLNR
jgi:hypothetical protein